MISLLLKFVVFLNLEHILWPICLREEDFEQHLQSSPRTQTRKEFFTSPFTC